MIAVAFNTDETGAFSAYIPNSSTNDITLERCDVVATACDLQEWEVLNGEQTVAAAQASARARPMRTHTPEEKAEIIKAITASVNRTVPYMYRQDYITMLSQREHFFSASSMDMGLTSLFTHQIDIKDEKPAFRQQFRLPYEHLRIINENVRGWLQAGIIERTNSPHNSPLFCVPKKHGAGLRTVLDLRHVNEKSTPDHYSIRTIDTCIDTIGMAGSKIFSALDFTNGFWQMALQENSRPYTAFTLPGQGQFRFKVTAQGLMGAPASFCRLMDLILRDAENVLTYLDDVLIHSKDHKSHIGHLRAVIDRIGTANLRLNPKKCIFGADNLDYLGHTLTSTGIRPGLDKAAAIRDAPPPTTPKGVKSFAGLANFFRGYISNFSRKIAPLHQIIRNDSKWKKGTLPPEAMQAFNTLKKEIAERPVMAFPNATGAYHLYVDAALGDSKHEGGLGAVLMQEQTNGQKRPIAYASRALKTHEKNYPAFLIELQAALYGIETFQHHLGGRRFYLYSDHMPLCKLSKTHEKTLQRLQHRLREMHPVIRHIKGNENTVADFLSRYSTPTDKSDQTCLDTDATMTHKDGRIDRIDASPFRIAWLQNKDAEIKDVKNRIGDRCDGSTPHSPIFVALNDIPLPLTIINGVLFVGRTGQTAGTDTDIRAWLPQTMRKEVLNEAHNSLLGGHMGVFKTSHRLRNEFFWPGMAKDIEAHVRSCRTCQEASSKGKDKEPLITPIPIPSGPGQRIHADLFGPIRSPGPSGPLHKHFVCVITDAFSKFTRAYVMDNKTAETAAETILKDIYVFGCPKMCITDQGAEWTNALQKAIWDGLNIEHKTTTPYHPQCNSQVETFNKTMKHYLAKAIAEAEAETMDWQLFLQPLILSYNSAVHSQTKMSPFQATFAYDPRIPLWDTELLKESEETSRASFQENLAMHRKAQSRARNIVYNSAQHAQERYQRVHNERAEGSQDYHEGDHVWVRKLGKTDANPKLAAGYEPAIILARESMTTYRVRRLKRVRRRDITINVQHIKWSDSLHQTEAGTQRDNTTGLQTRGRQDRQQPGRRQRRQSEDYDSDPPPADTQRPPPNYHSQSQNHNNTFGTIIYTPGNQDSFYTQRSPENSRLQQTTATRSPRGSPNLTQSPSGWNEGTARNFDTWEDPDDPIPTNISPQRRSTPADNQIPLLKGPPVRSLTKPPSPETLHEEEEEEEEQEPHGPQQTLGPATPQGPTDAEDTTDDSDSDSEDEDDDHTEQEEEPQPTQPQTNPATKRKTPTPPTVHQGPGKARKRSTWKRDSNEPIPYGLRPRRPRIEDITAALIDALQFSDDEDDEEERRRRRRRRRREKRKLKKLQRALDDTFLYSPPAFPQERQQQQQPATAPPPPATGTTTPPQQRKWRTTNTHRAALATPDSDDDGPATPATPAEEQDIAAPQRGDSLKKKITNMLKKTANGPPRTAPFSHRSRQQMPQQQADPRGPFTAHHQWPPTSGAQ